MDHAEHAPMIALPQVTLCAVTSINIEATLLALERCLAQVRFARCKLLVDQPVAPRHPAIEVVTIPRLRSSADYSDFLLRHLVEHVETSHCLIVQWDGHVLDARRWQPQFLDFDYIGARWPQFPDNHDVGNGGFSLRSRRLLELCANERFMIGGAEDVAICRTNRAWLERLGVRFAPGALADLFSTERAGNLSQSFGFHGAFNMPRALGPKAFGKVLQDLDDHATVNHDFWAIAADLVRQKDGIAIAGRMIRDRLMPRSRS